MHKPIKVLIDIRDLRIAKTGAKTYLEEIARELRKGRPGFEFFFADTIFPVYRGRNIFLKLVEHARFFFWKQVSLPLICIAKGCDILYCTDYFLPLVKFGYKTAVVFYDAFFWEYPEQYNGIWLQLLKRVGVPAAKRANAVITISAYSREQIIRYVGIDRDKIHAIHLAPKSSARELAISEASIDPSRKYILHIGVLEKRKNLLNLIKAYQLLLEEGFTDYYLVLAGNKITKNAIDDSSNIQELISKNGLQEHVILPGFVSDKELAHYYRNARLYAFVSLNEGFGLPVLEAFQNNLPVLIANNSCLPEIGGDAVLMCNPNDPADIKNQMKKIITSEILQNELREKGHKRLASFSWEKTTASLLEVFQTIAGKQTRNTT